MRVKHNCPIPSSDPATVSRRVPGDMKGVLKPSHTLLSSIDYMSEIVCPLSHCSLFPPSRVVIGLGISRANSFWAFGPRSSRHAGQWPKVVFGVAVSPSWVSAVAMQSAL